MNKDQPGPTAQRRSVDRIYVNQNFTSSRASLPGDIALLHLSTPLNRTSHVRPICLPKAQTNFPLSTTCFSAGFGTVIRGSRCKLAIKPLTKHSAYGLHGGFRNAPLVEIFFLHPSYLLFLSFMVDVIHAIKQLSIKWM